MDNYGELIRQVIQAGEKPIWCYDGEHILLPGGYTFVFKLDIYGNNFETIYESEDSIKFILGDVSQSGEWLLGSEFRIYKTEEGKAADTDLEVVMINITTGEKKYLTDNEVSDGSPKFNPDESLIAFSRMDVNESSSRQIYNLYVMNTDGSGVRQLTDFSYNNGTIRKAWSPGGKKIAFDNVERGAYYYRDSDIFIVDIESGEIIKITETAKDGLNYRLMDWK